MKFKDHQIEFSEDHQSLKCDGIIRITLPEGDRFLPERLTTGEHSENLDDIPQNWRSVTTVYVQTANKDLYYSHNGLNWFKY